MSDQRIFALGGDKKVAWEHPRFTSPFVHEAQILELPGGEGSYASFLEVVDAGTGATRRRFSL